MHAFKSLPSFLKNECRGNLNCIFAVRLREYLASATDLHKLCSQFFGSLNVKSITALFVNNLRSLKTMLTMETTEI